MILNTIFTYRCSRCNCEFEGYGIVAECSACRMASLLMYGGPIQGEIGGE